MKILMLVGVMSLGGLFACVAQPAPPLSTSVEVSDSEISGPAPELSGSTFCCIDYTCPTDGFETTGCKIGGRGPGQAFTECRQHCGMVCHAGEWICL
jgi:hypothetical protein